MYRTYRTMYRMRKPRSAAARTGGSSESCYLMRAQVRGRARARSRAREVFLLFFLKREKKKTGDYSALAKLLTSACSGEVPAHGTATTRVGAGVRNLRTTRGDERYDGRALVL